MKCKYYPRQAVWEMTLKCNMNCMHCGSKAGKQRDKELSLDECLDIAQQLINVGLEFITLIGGEIFFKQDWDKVARKFIDNGVYTNIITNGYNVREKQFEQIKNSGIKQIGISLDGMEKAHNTIRRRENAFSEAMSLFNRLIQNGYLTEAITTISDLNVDDLEDMYSLLVDNGVAIWQMQLCSPMGNAKEKLELLIDPKRVSYITDFIRRKNQEGKILIVAGDNIGYFGENEKYIRGNNEYSFNGCLAGLYVVGIDSVGNVKGCASLYDDKFIEGNLRKESLKDIWTKEGAFSYNRNFNKESLGGKCARCDKAEICRGGCRQLSYFTTGNGCESIYCTYNV